MGFKQRLDKINFLDHFLIFNFSRHISLLPQKGSLNVTNFLNNFFLNTFFNQYYILVNFFFFFFKLNKKILFFYLEVLLFKALFKAFSLKTKQFFLNSWFPGILTNIKQIRFIGFKKKSWVPFLPDLVVLFQNHDNFLNEVYLKKIPFIFFKTSSMKFEDSFLAFKNYYLFLSLLINIWNFLNIKQLKVLTPLIDLKVLRKTVFLSTLQNKI